MRAKYAELAGYQVDELLGKPLTLIDSKLHSDEFYAEIAMSLEKKGEWIGSVCNKAKNGRHYWVESQWSKVPQMNYCIRWIGFTCFGQVLQIRSIATWM